MKLLIIGANGMAGHVMVRYFQEQEGYRVFYTTRDARHPYSLFLDAKDAAGVNKAIDLVRPDVIINAAGILNQFADHDPVTAYQVNGLFPHLLRQAADQYGARLIHISTDCVFSGQRGAYTESDSPDGCSTYALTKKLGEVHAPGHLTIRTSIIGPEIRENGIGLLQWFFRQQGEVPGYRRVLWNGVTTLQLAKTTEQLLSGSLSGLIHLAHPHTVSKYELLLLFSEFWPRPELKVVPDDEMVQDRTLVSTRPDVRLNLPEYRTMLWELAEWMKVHA
ncbi:NAD(P)-dependent oxidoreductase [Paenibacillus sp. CAA11]|uniref:dTDP-4-dehydrorhamnose reductase family protein n=1 Tax=Paenibacillus sp. CAA11 TaxID=1532905 RepID=UPI000D3D6745|nr:SDR family oxidoreductase [Paenibacillus sp. CAA11]AWB45809.1 NAD(P)-dependent oxidoreductase [Paenibacillus sp. CAA11]